MSPGKLRFSGAGTAGRLRRRAGLSACVPPPYQVSCSVVFCLFPARSLYRLPSDWKSVHTSSGRCVLHNVSQRQDKKTRIAFVIQCDEKESFSNEIRDFMKGIFTLQSCRKMQRLPKENRTCSTLSKYIFRRGHSKLPNLLSTTKITKKTGTRQLQKKHNAKNIF